MAPSATGYFKRLSRRLTEDPDVSDAEQMADRSVATGAMPAVQCCRGTEVTLLGRLRCVNACSKSSSASVEAELFDGTDSVTLVWIGQRRIPGIEVGRTVMVKGRMGERDGTKVIYNPYYELREDTDAVQA